MKRPRQRTTHTRFQTALGMSAIRHDLDVYNAMHKRGLVERSADIVREHFVICGCGAQGCGFTSVVRRGDDAIDKMRAGKDPWRIDRRQTQPTQPTQPTA